MVCQKCKDWFSQNVVIDGVHRNLSHRRFCLTCMPFKARTNGQQSWKNQEILSDQKVCVDCCRPIRRKNRCSSCSVSRSRKKKLKILLLDILGGKCVFCGYGGEIKWRALVMHHVENRSFCVNDGAMGFGWKKIIEEAKKCVLVCCNCHQEIHLGIIHESIVLEGKRKLWEEKKERWLSLV